MNISNFDQTTWFIDGEDSKYIVEYILADDGGFCHRASPFLIPVGTIFEHNYGSYIVKSIDRKAKNIIVYCERIDSNKPMFDFLIKMGDEFN